MTGRAPPSPDRPGPILLRGFLDLRPRLGAEPAAVAAAEDAVAQGLAAVQAYAFASVDYPGAAEQVVFDSNGTAAVGAFQFDPSAVAPTPRTGFTFTGGVYQILSVPGSISSDASGINGAGLIVGAYEDLSGALRGYANNGGTVANIDLPGARATEPVGVNDAGRDLLGCDGSPRLPAAGWRVHPISFPPASWTSPAPAARF